MEDGDKVYVADRWNNRVQFFTPKGEFLGEWTGLNPANAVRKGADGLFYVAELDHRISILSPEGALLARWGDTGAELELDDSDTGGGLPDSPSRNPMIKGKVMHEPGPGLFGAPHGIAVDSEGSFYVAEVSETYLGIDRGDRSVQKFVRVLRRIRYFIGRGPLYACPLAHQADGVSAIVVATVDQRRASKARLLPIAM